MDRQNSCYRSRPHVFTNWGMLALMFMIFGGIQAPILDARISGKNPDLKPNIIFILVDDLRYNALSCLGHPFVETPNIDRIAEEGVIFDNFFVTTSLCSPSRASFLTGLYAHNHGVIANEYCDPTGPDIVTFPEVLQEAGYRTAFIGKWHMEGHAEKRPGFDYWLSFKGQGKYEGNQLNVNGLETSSDSYLTDELNRYAVEWIQDGLKRESPFFLYLSHKAVHGPFTPAKRHVSLYDEAILQQPPSWNDSFEDKPEEMRKVYANDPEWAAVSGERTQRQMWYRGEKIPLWDPPLKLVPKRLGPRKWDEQRRQTLDYFRAISAVDDGVGRIYRVLSKLGVLENTVIIFAGDNGFSTGEHRRFAGKRTAYEESIRIPFLMRWPDVVAAGSHIREMGLNIDLAPTLIELAGSQIPSVVDGRSLIPLLEGNPTNWRTAFIYEYFKEPWTQRFPNIVGVRTTEWKYITYPDSKEEYTISEELYDLIRDPEEMTNLIGKPEYRNKANEMRRLLNQLKRETHYSEPDLNNIYGERFTYHTKSETSGDR